MLCNSTSKPEPNPGEISRPNPKREFATIKTENKKPGRLTFGGTLLAVGLHCDMRVQVVQCTICLLASLPPTFVHALNLLVAATGALVLLSTWDWNKRVDLRKRVRILFQGLSQTDGVEGMRATHLTRTWSGTGRGSLGRGSCSRRAVWSTRHSMWMASVLLRPMLRVSRRWVALVMIHVVRRVWRVGRVRRT